MPNTLSSQAEGAQGGLIVLQKGYRNELPLPEAFLADVF